MEDYCPSSKKQGKQEKNTFEYKILKTRSPSSTLRFLLMKLPNSQLWTLKLYVIESHL